VGVGCGRDRVASSSFQPLRMSGAWQGLTFPWHDELFPFRQLSTTAHACAGVMSFGCGIVTRHQPE
jgi:hypothetical protein